MIEKGPTKPMAPSRSASVRERGQGRAPPQEARGAYPYQSNGCANRPASLPKVVAPKLVRSGPIERRLIVE